MSFAILTVKLRFLNNSLASDPKVRENDRISSSERYRLYSKLNTHDCIKDTTVLTNVILEKRTRKCQLEL